MAKIKDTGVEDPTAGIKRLEQYGQYAQAVMLEENGEVVDVERYEGNLDFEERAEIAKMVETVQHAWRNQIHLDISVRALWNIAKSEVPDKEEALRQEANPEKGHDSVLYYQPAVFIDQSEVVCGWYLPSVLTPTRNNEVFEAVEDLCEWSESVLGGSRELDDRLYADPRVCQLIPGECDLTPCGSEPQQTANPVVGAPSACFEDPETGALNFIGDMRTTNALMGALLALVHPDLFNEQIDVLYQLAKASKSTDTPRMSYIRAYWTTPFTQLSLVVNRETPFYFTPSRCSYDIFAAFGVQTKGRLEVPALRARFAFNPGDVVIIPGGLLESGVSKCLGEMICLASHISAEAGLRILPRYKELEPPLRSSLVSNHGLPGGRGLRRHIWGPED
ncbi:hypothetical protein NMY22_g7432 [Coprinellus aureogranulatus]|nr:hypothetical protein NMY22_g7432 [Coprinellus aureogranulatus]